MHFEGCEIMAEPTDGKLKKEKIEDNKMDQPW